MSEGNQEDKPPPGPQRPPQEDGGLLSSLPDMHCIKTLQETSASVLRMVSTVKSYNILYVHSRVIHVLVPRYLHN